MGTSGRLACSTSTSPCVHQRPRQLAAGKPPFRRQHPTTAAAAVAMEASAVAGGASPGAGSMHAVLGTSLSLSQISQVRMRILGPCKMGISFWPMFRFKAPDREEQPGRVTLNQEAAAVPAAASDSGSGEEAAAPAGAGAACGSQLLNVDFTQDPPDEFTVGAKFLCGIPFPFLSIRTTCLRGVIDPTTGRVELEFRAQFLAQMGSKAPTVLPINASLTSEAASAFSRHLQGSRLQQGRTTLVSAAEVPKTPSWFANVILLLPTAATAVLPMQLEFL